ncbi:hypothetical protein RHGRI_036622 [Rhododendron griersonianum]|uniref:Uncharacterized protein n=1 Tax=Rhododendron griersonianum TaxID=479676 RepID=A0AAV6HP52_9ERIC|nr:hypothetical protein RHGRI_036622 [Rhododendron griersonianum]
MRGIIGEKPNYRKITINGSLCTKINENRSILICTTPVLGIDHISLPKSGIALWFVIEVIKCLGVKKGFQVL